MGRKNTIQYQISDDQSLGADFTTTPTVIRYLDNISYQINITTADSTGSFYIQGSNDYQVNEVTDSVSNSGTWVDLTLGGGTPSAGAADDSILISMNQVPFYALRVKYVHNVAGTGTCDIYLVARQVGA